MRFYLFRQHGFVLLMTLTILAIAGVIAGVAARRSGALALRANAAREQLRRRWAETSLRHTLVNRIGGIIARAEAEADTPLNQARRELQAGGMTFELLFGDEQARANVDLIYRRRGKAGLESFLRRLCVRAGNPIAVALRPAPQVGGPRDTTSLAFVAFGQLFGPGYLAGLLDKPGDGTPLVSEITCWGDGKLNFRRCSPAALREVTAGILTGDQQQRLISLRQDIPGMGLSEALKRLELPQGQQAKAAAVLTDRSACYSLWIVTRTPRRCWYRLDVVGTAAVKDGGGEVRTFTW